MVGPPAAGKTTLRGRLLAAGLPARQVVSLDDLRRELAAQALAAGRPARNLQAWTLPALRRAAELQADLLAAGLGYLIDATNLRRRERVGHVRLADLAGLPAVALLLPALPLEVLQERNAARPVHERVPGDVLARHWHRRSLLSAALLRGEGFTRVDELA